MHELIGKNNQSITVGLAKMAELFASDLSRFLECQTCNILVVPQLGKSAWPDIYTHNIGVHA